MTLPYYTFYDPQVALKGPVRAFSKRSARNFIAHIVSVRGAFRPTPRVCGLRGVILLLLPVGASLAQAQDTATPAFHNVAALRECQRTHNRECGQVVWSDGSVSGIVIGERDRVVWSNLVKIRAATGKGIELHHTHPTDSPLSVEDVTTLSWPGIGVVCAHGPTVSDCRVKYELGAR